MTRTERRLAERFGLKIPLRIRIAKSAALEHSVESLNVLHEAYPLQRICLFARARPCISISRCQKRSHKRFAPALQLFNAARDAYDDRPRRDRDACSKMFDAMESVAKEKYQMPNSTYLRPGCESDTEHRDDESADYKRIECTKRPSKYEFWARYDCAFSTIKCRG